MACVQRVISRHSGALRAPISAASSVCSSCASVASDCAGRSGLRRPPMKVVSSTVPSGARPSNMLLENSVPRIRRRSFFGTRKPKPASEWRDVGAPPGGGDTRDGRVLDRREPLRRRRRQLAQQPRGLVRGHGEHDRAAARRTSASPRAHARHRPSAVGAALDALHAHAGRDAIDGAGQRVGQRLHPAAKREAPGGVLRLLGALPALARALDLPLDQAAVLLLQRVQARKRGRHRDPLRIAGIDAGRRTGRSRSRGTRCRGGGARTRRSIPRRPPARAR